jgi:hypothetical protein
MILFTGSGAISECFLEYFPCKIISARNLSNYDLSNWILKADVIIHNAAIIKSENFKDYIDGNFILTKRILDLVTEIKPSIKFINISSMSILSSSDEYLQVNEMSDYAFSKFISEKYCLKNPIVKCANVRFSTILYGNEKRDGISKLIYDCVKNNEITIYNNGSALRDIIPLKIICHYLYKLSISEINFKTINIASGYSTSFMDIANILKAKNEKLKINNLTAPNLVEVLSNFPEKKLDLLGVIDFDLKSEILTIYDKLSESVNLQ